MASISTGAISTKLGFMVTQKFVTEMGLKPVDTVKGHPQWNPADMPKLRDAIKAHLDNVCTGDVVAEPEDDPDEL